MPTPAKNITLPHAAGLSIPVVRVAALVKGKPHNGTIIIGKFNCTLADHPKLHSLDHWLRNQARPHHDTRQATEAVVAQLTAPSAPFKRVRARCPLTGRWCNALKLK